MGFSIPALRSQEKVLLRYSREEPALGAKPDSVKEHSLLLELPTHHRCAVLLIENEATTNGCRTPGVRGGIERTSWLTGSANGCTIYFVIHDMVCLCFVSGAEVR